MRRKNPSQALDEIVGPEASKALEAYYGNDVRRVFQAPKEELERLMLGEKRLTKPQVKQILLMGKAITDHLGAYATHMAIPKVGNALGIRDWFLRTTDTLEMEEVWIVAVDAKNRPYQKVFISRGSLSASLIHPREVFAPLIRGRAHGFFLIHNHPSGDSTPSAEDVDITRRLMSVANLIGLRFLDHVVIGKGGNYTSLEERGLLHP